MFRHIQTIDNILCVKCGISMQPNTTNMCLRCLCSEVDITEELLRHLVLVHCSECESYLQPPRTWDKSLLTSRDLVEYIVLTLEVVSSKVGSSEVTMCGTEYVLADVQVARKSDFGRNDTILEKILKDFEVSEKLLAVEGNIEE
ncbi:unnamed protein product [Trifolium pratense]|uniref:Uncharacterized protein n=1 Tax=Trifolium pratense TaxID=57577 RepID=A0ACB0L5H6_TRIPR|nr:unnamed protein product [Trifolium pratense]